MNYFFRIEWLLIEWQCNRIGDHVVHKRRPAGSRIAEIMRLHWRRPIAQDLRSGMLGMSAQIDGDMHAKLCNQARSFKIIARPHVMKLIKCGC
jgi:hypothetical protein